MRVQTTTIPPTEAAIAISTVMTVLPVFDMAPDDASDSVGSEAATVVLVTKVTAPPVGRVVVGIVRAMVAFRVGVDDVSNDEVELVVEDVPVLVKLAGGGVAVGTAAGLEGGGEAEGGAVLEVPEGVGVTEGEAGGGRMGGSGDRFLTKRFKEL